MYTLPYGDSSVSFTLPKEIDPRIITYAITPPSGQPADILKQAMLHPVESPRLVELTRGKRDAVILISDGSRLVPSHLLLPHLLDELNEGGIADRNITVITALGMHRHHTPEELERLTGPDVYRRVRVINHSAMEADCVYLGDTAQGTPVMINRHVVEADLRIATGNLEPHRLAGISGGIKAVIPGCASRRCIQANHSLSQKYKVVPGLIENPVHQDLEEAAAYAPIHFLLNVVVNHRRDIMAAAAGNPLPAHRTLLHKVKAIFMVEPPVELYDFTIVSAGGAPKDKQLYQAVKTLQNASAFTKPEGAILLAAECGEHYGNGIMQLWAETVGDKSTILRALEKQFVLGAHKLKHLYDVMDKQSVWLQSSMPSPLTELLGFQTAASSLQLTLDAILDRFRLKDIIPLTAILPYGALTFPAEESKAPQPAGQLS